MKETRKTPNILIRDLSKKSKEQNQSSFLISKTNFPDKKKSSPNDIETQKQIMKAENLSEQEQTKIRKQAERTVSRKVQSTQNKIEDKMIQILQQQCRKIGQELERQRADNIKLKLQISQMRKNMDYLNRKIQGMFKDQQSLSKNNDFGKMQKQQMKQQLINLQMILKSKQEQFQYEQHKYKSQIEEVNKTNYQKESKIIKLQNQIKCLKQQMQQISYQLQQSKNQNKYIRKQFEQRKQQWDLMRKQYQESNKVQIEKKGEKITKYHVQLQNLTQKLKQEESVRKKALDKNKDVEKQLAKKNDTIKEQQQQISTLKKRVNDLSILKSTNNTIMNNKITALQSQNLALKAQINNNNIQNNTQQSKPYLFGPNYQ